LIHCDLLTSLFALRYRPGNWYVLRMTVNVRQRLRRFLHAGAITDVDSHVSWTPLRLISDHLSTIPIFAIPVITKVVINRRPKYIHSLLQIITIIPYNNGLYRPWVVSDHVVTVSCYECQQQHQQPRWGQNISTWQQLHSVILLLSSIIHSDRQVCKLAS